MKMDGYKNSDNFQRTEGCKMISPHHSHPTNGVGPSDVNMKAVVGVLAETLLVCRQAIGRFLPMLCTVYVACILASGCASDGSLYGEMKKFRESEVRGRGDWLPIPGLSGRGIECQAPATLNYFDGHSETHTYDPLIMHVDGVRDGIPVDYVCKAQEHPAASLKRGSAIVFAVLKPEVFDVDVCGETGVPIRHRHVAGYHVELKYINVKECTK